MVEVPFIVSTAVVAQGLPLLALLARRNRSRPVRWVAGGIAVSLLGTLLGRIAAARMGNNHWLAAISDPLMFALFLAALEEWQITYLERLTFRITLFVVLVVYILLVAFVEDVSTLSRFGIPMYSLVLTGAGAWTLFRRAFRTTDRALWATDWWWIVGGLTLYAATTMLAHPIGGVFLAAQRIDLFVRIWEFRAVCVDIAMVAVTVGFLNAPAPLAAPQ
jgi:hypothetical protein